MLDKVGGFLGLSLLTIMLGWLAVRFFERKSKIPRLNVRFEEVNDKSHIDEDSCNIPEALRGAPSDVIDAYMMAAVGTPLHANLRNLSSFFRGTSIGGNSGEKQIIDSGFSAGMINRCRALCARLDEEIFDPTEAPGRVVAKRRTALSSTAQAILRMSRVTLLAGIDAMFENEDGRDAGGVVKEYLTEVTTEIQELALFRVVADGTLHISENAPILLVLALGRLIGAIVAWAARRLAFGGTSSPTLDLSLCKPLAKLIAGEKIAATDIASVDPELYRTRIEISRSQNGIHTLRQALGLENDDLLFAWYDPISGEPTEPLHPQGFEHKVTEDNVDLYVRETAEFYLLNNVRRQTAALINGVHSILGDAKIIQHRDLLLLLNGVANFDLIDWRKNTIIQVPATVDTDLASRVVHTFWSILNSDLTNDARSRLLLYSTGAATLPPPGTFAQLQPKFKIVLDPTLPLHHLPVAHTCFNQLHLPLLDDPKKLSSSLQLALDHGLGSFGLA